MLYDSAFDPGVQNWRGDMLSMIYTSLPHVRYCLMFNENIVQSPIRILRLGTYVALKSVSV